MRYLLTTMAMFLVAAGAMADPTVSITKLLNGSQALEAEPGTVASSVSNNVCTLTVTPAAGNYVTSANIKAYATVTGDVAQSRRNAPQSRRNAPQLDNAEITVTATDATADPSGVTTYTLDMPDDGSNIEVTVDFQSRVSIAQATIADIADQVYTGNAITPAVTVTLGNTTLTATSHYTLAYADNTNVGTATITVTGAGIYTGTATKTFAITAVSLADATIADIAAQSYTGAAITPAVTVTLGNTTLSSETDYTVAYSDNTNVGTATVTVTGKGNYSGTATTTFAITAVSLADATIADIAAQSYTGAAITPAVTVTLGNTTLSSETDYTVSYSDNTNVGTATVTVTGKGNYSGTATKTFAITAVSLADATIADIAAQSYTGAAITPAVTVTLGNTTLSSETDYTVAYSDNTNVGTATVTVTGKGNYSGTATTTFAITAVSLADATIADIAAQSYTGAAITPAVTVTLGNTTLSSETDYTVAYSDNTNVGTATVTVTGKGNYSGTATTTFAITAVSLADATIADIAAQSYTGAAITPAVTVTLGNTTLSSETDYTVAYSDNTNVGTATVTVTGKGNYSGTATKTFAITAVSLADATIADIAAQSYTGAAITPAVTVTLGNTTLSSETDYTVAYSDNTNVGTATVTVTGKGNYSGTATKTFTITAVSLADATIADIAAQSYTGAAITPAVTVTLGNTTLSSETDYTVAYSDNTNVGTATVTVTGKGNYSGTATKTFTITAVSLADATIADIAAQSYTGAAITPAVTVTLGNTTLSSETDYTVAYSDNTNVGTATVTVTGKGNYSGTATTTFAITAVSLADATIADIAAQSYTGAAITPAVTVTLGNTTLSSETDYTVAYSNNTNVGTATVTVTGKGNYSGTATKTFAITAVSLADATIADIAAQSYTGAAITPAVTVTLGNTTLSSETDYTVAYSDNTNVGTATVTVTGKGNYSGTATTTFTITAVSLADATIADIAAQSYTGAAITPAVTVTLGNTILSSETDYTVAYSDNTNVGTATVTVTGKGNYSGTATKTFAITAVSLADATIADIAAQSYTGAAITPAVTVTLGNTILSSETDYTVAYSDNTNVGTATVTVTGKGNYSGTATKTFAITAVSLADATIADIAAQSYTGAAITPAVTVTLGNTTLSSETDYTVSYSNNTNVGTATVTVTGKGNYSGTATTTFAITAVSLADATIADISAQSYTGAAITPAVTVTLGNTTLSSETDYTVSYSNNTNVGTATITITGKGNYSGTATTTFAITAVSLADATIADIAAQSYTGAAITPAVTVTLGNTTLSSETDYTVSYSNNTNVGTATVTVTGKGNYSGTATTTFAITAVSLADATIADIAAQSYTGAAITPAVTVTLGNTTLSSETDYTVAYSDNTNVGTATVTVTGKGNYSGTATKTFTITAVSLADATIAYIAAQSYTGAAITPAVTVTLGNTTLSSETDYTVAYSNNTNVGTATITITGKGNYSGTATKTFAITAVSLADATIADIAAQSYTGAAITPAVTVTLGNTTLSSETDYTVAYSDNTNVGTATITITGKGNYSGTATKTFTITAVSLADATIADIAAQSYTGAAITPAVTVTLGNTTLSSETDYTVSYSNNTNVGTATVTVTGKGNYSGTATKTFAITAVSLADATIADIAAQSYTGAAITPAVTVTLGNTTLSSETDYTVSYSDNTNVGTATVTVTGKGNYSGTATTTFAITAVSLADATIADIAAQSYTGAAITPAVTVTLGNTTLSSETDYTVSYSDNTNVGTATVTVTGKGNYSGTATKTFAITAVSLADATIADIAAQSYTGAAITPAVTVTLGNTTLSSETDYTVAYSNNTNVGTATITITGKGNYSGTATTTFAITAVSLADATIADIAAQSYTGAAITPAVTVTLGNTTLSSETDYTVAYSDNTNVGTATITITGKGNYSGTATKTFAITAVSLADATIADIAAQSYTGAAITPAVTVTLGNTTLSSETDYTVAYSNNTNVGTATITITGKGNYSGTATTTFAITAVSLADATIADIAAQSYTGAAITPAVTVTLGNTTLSSETDYTVAYSDNTNVGTATITITGKGNYSGTATTTFEIVAASATITVAQISQTVTYNATAQAITGVSVDKGTAIITYYTSEGERNKGSNGTTEAPTNAGTYYVQVTQGSDSYVSTPVNVTFVIEKATITSMTLSDVELPYSGSEQTVSVTKVMAGDLELPVDAYEVSGNTGTAVGDYTVTVTAKAESNFQGTTTAGFSIINRVLEEGKDIVFATGQGYATYYSTTESLELPQGIVAYVATGVSGSTVIVQPISYIPKNVAVLLEKSSDEVEVNDDFDANLLRGTTEQTAVSSIVGGTVYVLYNGEFVKTVGGSIPANRAYLVVSNGANAGARLSIVRDGESTRISEVAKDATDDVWYDLNGRKLNGKPTKEGLYIQKGKKLYVK